MAHGGVWGAVVSFEQASNVGSSDEFIGSKRKAERAFMVDVLINTAADGEGERPDRRWAPSGLLEDTPQGSRLRLLHPKDKKGSPQVLAVPLAQVRKRASGQTSVVSFSQSTLVTLR